MLAMCKTCAVLGLEGHIIEVEVGISPGLPAFTVVGLPDTAVQESRERVRSAIRNSGFDFPMRRITVNLAPADLKKAGPAYDLPIAAGILFSSGQVTQEVSQSLFLGELSLDGSLRRTNGVLPMVAVGRQQGFGTVFVPTENAVEASLVEGVEVIPVSNLAELAGHLRGELEIRPFSPSQDAKREEGGQAEVQSADYATVPDLAHIRGQEHAKRALEVAAAGAHNLMMIGPPGSGKTLLARALPSILPLLSSEEALDVTRIYSVSGLLPPEHPLIVQRPFRAPHYNISSAGLVGGGRLPKPGEITLAHRGVLFLDELPEFGHSSLESLRQPMEGRTVTISRAERNVTFPANFMLVAAMNPCPCGFYGDPKKHCSCPPSVVAKYQRRISGPLLDRIDMFAEVPAVEYEELVDSEPWETSAEVRKRVSAAREVQRARFDEIPLTSNSEMGPKEVWDLCQAEDSAKGLLQAAMNQLSLSARAFHRVLKLSLTIADLAGSETIGVSHVAEALQHRPRGLV